MSKYQEFIESLGIISKEEFNKVLDTFPGIEIHFNELSYSDYIVQNKTSLAYEIFNAQLTRDFFIDGCDFNTLEYEIWYDNSYEIPLKNLDEIVNRFPKWKLLNYNEVKEALIADKNLKISNKLSQELYKIINSYSLERKQEMLNNLKSNDNQR